MPVAFPQFFATLLLLNVAAIESATNKLGPGRGPWKVETPEMHGLKTADLNKAATNVAKVAPERYCFVVVKDGVIVHESYYHNNSETVYETDSMFKLATAQVVGVAVSKGLLDLDKPLSDYGISANRANWSKYNNGSDYFANVTARHLLGQVSGMGWFEPGEAFTYDSYEYLQHLSYLLSKVTGRDAVRFATSEYAVPMGFPDLYTMDAELLKRDGFPDIPSASVASAGKDIYCGGGQMATCRDAARVGQLVVNKGAWLDADEQEYQLLSKAYVAEQLKAQYPEINSYYGLLTYLNQPVNVNTSAECCAGRWGDTTCDYGLDTRMIGDNIMDMYAPDDAVVSMGWLGKYIYAVPSENLVVATIGHTWGSSDQCAMTDDCTYCYDDDYTMSLIWRAFHNLTITDQERQQYETRRARASQEAAGKPPRKIRSMSASGGVLPTGPWGRSSSTSKRPATKATEASADLGVMTSPEAPMLGEQVDGDHTIGSCYCYCPSDQGFGTCFNVNKKGQANNCTGFMTRASEVCPNVGLSKQCNVTAGSNGTCANTTVESTDYYDGCTQTANCELAINGKYATEACTCRVKEFYYCEWSKDACNYSPWFPPAP